MEGSVTLFNSKGEALAAVNELKVGKCVDKRTFCDKNDLSSLSDQLQWESDDVPFDNVPFVVLSVKKYACYCQQSQETQATSVGTQGSSVPAKKCKKDTSDVTFEKTDPPVWLLDIIKFPTWKASSTEDRNCEHTKLVRSIKDGNIDGLECFCVRTYNHKHSKSKSQNGVPNASSFTFSESPSLEQMRQLQAEFSNERDWNQYHTPRNLLLALVGEVGELAEIFQWKGEVKEGLGDWSEKDRTHVSEELSDVLIYLIRLADKCHIDLPMAVLHKMALNRRKYPAALVKGLSKKYTEYNNTDEEQQSEVV